MKQIKIFEYYELLNIYHLKVRAECCGRGARSLTGEPMHHNCLL